MIEATSDPQFEKSEIDWKCKSIFLIADQSMSSQAT